MVAISMNMAARYSLCRGIEKRECRLGFTAGATDLPGMTCCSWNGQRLGSVQPSIE